MKKERKKSVSKEGVLVGLGGILGMLFGMSLGGTPKAFASGSGGGWKSSWQKAEEKAEREKLEKSRGLWKEIPPEGESTGMENSESTSKVKRGNAASEFESESSSSSAQGVKSSGPKFKEPTQSLSGKVRVIRSMGGMTEVFFTNLNESYFIPSGNQHNAMMKTFEMSEKNGTSVSFTALESSRRIVEVSSGAGNATGGVGSAGVSGAGASDGERTPASAGGGGNR